ncbi:MFS transporter [Synechococcus sp. CCY9201]|uniref:MFS transporter n=1 Tax=Synechococcus sp. CCY9201 TaxID=174697 RepID=UPI002B207B9E|nr:MFS transporter [Synechococcus sp. CCY9201]MEA5472829.1 MFS transporter [Synechococcus sp. CCY9201]
MIPRAAAPGRPQTLYACLGLALGQAGLFMALPSLPAMAAEFGVSDADAQGSITLYALGYGLSQLLWGPLADRHGRRPVALGGVALYSLISLALVMVPGFGALLVLRLLQGVAAGCGTSVSRACLRDVASGRELARAMGVVAMSYAVALGVAPFLGGWIGRLGSWRGDDGLLAVLGGLTYAYLARNLTETRVRPPVPTTQWNLRGLLPGYGKLLRDPRFLVPALIATLGTGLVAGYDAASPFDFERRFGFSTAGYGNLNLLLSAAYLLGSLALTWNVERLGQQRLLWAGAATSVGGAAVMLLLGLAGRFDPLSLLLPMLVVVVGVGVVVPLGLALPMQAFPERAGQASALTGFLQQEGTALLVALAVALHGGSQVPLGLSLLVLALLLALLVRIQGRLG